jgi:hypothetical protein
MLVSNAFASFNAITAVSFIFHPHAGGVAL